MSQTHVVVDGDRGGMYVATRRGDEAAVPKGTRQAAVSELGTGRP